MTDDVAKIAAGLSEGYEVHQTPSIEPRHVWWIKGAHGGVHIWAKASHLEGWPSEWIGGVEVHLAQCPDDGGWFKPDQPSQEDCWLLDGPCWHDGTSLYFSERIAPRMPHPDSDYRNDPERMPVALIQHELRSWYEDRVVRNHLAGESE
jgi:hypothetical protein